MCAFGIDYNFTLISKKEKALCARSCGLLVQLWWSNKNIAIIYLLANRGNCRRSLHKSEIACEAIWRCDLLSLNQNSFLGSPLDDNCWYFCPPCISIRLEIKISIMLLLDSSQRGLRHRCLGPREGDWQALRCRVAGTGPSFLALIFRLFRFFFPTLS